MIELEKYNRTHAKNKACITEGKGREGKGREGKEEVDKVVPGIPFPAPR